MKRAELITSTINFDPKREQILLIVYSLEALHFTLFDFYGIFFAKTAATTSTLSQLELEL